eukprot:gene1408-12028_t
MFGSVAQPKSVKKLSSPHNSSKWSQEFKKASTSKNSFKLKKLRVEIMTDTLSAFIFQSYILQDKTEVKLDEKTFLQAALNTKLYTKDTSIKEQQNKFETNILVIEGDCLEIAVLNMANEKYPGGGYLTGSGAQEENLHRRTNLFQCLHDPLNVKNSKTMYPIPKIGGIFSPNVCVIRCSEFEGYEFFTMPEYISILTVSAVQYPKVNKKTHEMDKNDENLNKEKMRIIFKMAMDNDIECVVLSAFGCGAFENPPDIIANLFKEVLKEFKNQFKFVVFAIYEDHNSSRKHNKEGNVKPFADTFGLKSKTLSEFRDL